MCVCVCVCVYVCVALLQIRSTLMGHSLPSLAAILFNRPAGCSVLRFGRPPMLFADDESIDASFVKRQLHENINTDTHDEIIPFFQSVTCSSAVERWGDLGCMEQQLA